VVENKKTTLQQVHERLLRSVHEPTTLRICLIAEAYPFAWAGQCIAWLRNQARYQVMVPQFKDMSSVAGMVQQQQFFAGQTMLWFGASFYELPSKQHGEFSRACDGAGPSISFVWVTPQLPPSLQTMDIVTLPDHLVFDDFVALASLVGVACTERRAAIIRALLKEHSKIRLDEGVLLLRYLELLPQRNTDEAVCALREVYFAYSSLFELAKWFFARNGNALFATWAQLEHEYTYPFWCTFWAEQVWRAYHVTILMRQQRFVDARRVATRLPFSFIQQHWRTVSLDELRHCHRFLYQADNKYKNGSQLAAFDHFYMKYLHHAFK
jgi:hypothetical protein